GRVKVWDKVSHKGHMFFREEIGPPYDPNDLEKRVYDLSMQQNNGQVIVNFHIESGRFPGLHIKRNVVFTSSPLMQVTHTLENFNIEPTTCTVMLRLGMNDTKHSNGRSFVPTADRIISETSSLYPVQTDDFPSEPDKVTEQWVAYEVDNQTHGVIWTEASKHKLRWGMIDLYPNEVTLKPGNHITHAPITIYCGNGSWQDVRRIWQRVAGDTNKVQPTVTTAFQLSLQPSPLLTLSDNVETTLTAKNGQKLALKGTLALDLPTGWQTDQSSFEIASLEQGETFNEQLKLTAPKKVAPATAMLQMDTPSADITVPVPLLRLGDDQQSVQILEGIGTDEKPLLTMRNGRCTWLIAPQYHGGIVAWRDSSDENHLLTKYPDPYANFTEFTPFHGGIMPTLINQEAGDWFGKLYDESFTHQVIETVDAHQLHWQGVRVSATMKRDVYKGLKVELEYLTLPGSNVLKAVYRVVNETAVYRAVHPEFYAYCQVDGNYSNSEIVTADYHRKRVKEDYWEWHPSKYAAIVNPDTSRCIVMVKATGRHNIFLQDLGEFGGHMAASEQLTIPPHGSNAIVIYLALTESLADAKQYAALADLT
ncbi:MAG: hypothetical protein GY943_12040, partial [Chloroflexi bacterium]|nr:hypothetical protein [Chloroflexota bacterium]